ncbi:MAG TPA: amidohydrolase family protein, partial [Minicystis sp.]|nr:amidohydrolase family protein [Minicystis sp.]
MQTIWTDLRFDGERFSTEPAALTLDRGVITRIEPLADRAAPAPGGVHDARGALTLPGLVNAHVHIARGGVFEPNERISLAQTRRNLEGCLAAGVTTIGDMACAPALVRELKRYLAKDPRRGPAIRAAGPIVTAPRGYPLDWLPPLFARLGLALPCATERDAQAAAARVAEAGMDHVKLAVMHESYARKPIPAVKEAVARALVREAHALGLRVLAHAHTVADYRVALAAGVDALMHSSFEPLDEDLVARVAAAGVPVCPTLWVFESACLGVEMRLDADARYTRHVEPYIRASWRRFAEAFAASGDVLPDGMAGGLEKSVAAEAIRNASANLLLLRDAGVPIVFGNDASYGFSLVARPVDELGAMQRAGMPPEACLRAATSAAAALLRCDDRGTLAVGKRADVVVADARARD